MAESVVVMEPRSPQSKNYPSSAEDVDALSQLSTDDHLRLIAVHETTLMVMS